MAMPDPKYRTSAKPIIVDGVTFRCYRAGPMRYHWISDDGRIWVGRNYNRDTYTAAVGDQTLTGTNPARAKRFRTQGGAMLAAVNTYKR